MAFHLDCKLMSNDVDTKLVFPHFGTEEGLAMFHGSLSLNNVLSSSVFSRISPRGENTGGVAV